MEAITGCYVVDRPDDRGAHRDRYRRHRSGGVTAAERGDHPRLVVAHHGLHPLHSQLRSRGPYRRRTHRARARRQVASDLAGLHVREGTPARPLPERQTSADHAAQAEGRRDVRADRLGHGDRRGRRAARRDTRHLRWRLDLLLRRRRSGEPPGRRLRRRDPLSSRQRLLLERSRAGEDRRVLGRRQALRRDPVPHDRRLRARRGRGLHREEPVALPRVSRALVRS